MPQESGAFSKIGKPLEEKEQNLSSSAAPPLMDDAEVVDDRDDEDGEQLGIKRGR